VISFDGSASDLREVVDTFARLGGVSGIIPDEIVPDEPSLLETVGASFLTMFTGQVKPVVGMAVADLYEWFRERVLRRRGAAPKLSTPDTEGDNLVAS